MRLLFRRAGTRQFTFAAVTFLLLTVPVSAQQLRRPSAWGAGVLVTPLLIAHGGLAMRCNPRAAERAGWGADRIEKVLRLTEPQRAALNDVRTAVIAAADPKTGACPVDLSRNSAEQLSFTVKRLDVLQKAVAAIEPSFATFYKLLDGDQRTQLDARPRRWRLR